MDRNRDAVARNIARDAVKLVLDGERQRDGIPRDLLHNFMFAGIPQSEWYSIVVDAAARVVDHEPREVPLQAQDFMREVRRRRGEPEPEAVLDAQLAAREILRELAQKLHQQRHRGDGFAV